MSSKRPQSVVACFTGARGSGKTLSMVVEAVIRMVGGERVWSNVDICFGFRYPSGRVETFQSLPLDMEALYSFDEGLAEGCICLDEVNLWIDSRRSMSVGNRLINGVFQLIRKRQLSMLLTVQSFTWLDSRIRWQCDSLVRCKDLGYSYDDMDHGVFIAQTLTDESGLMTGTPNADRNYPLNIERTLFGKIFWNCYDTMHEFDVLQAQRRVVVNGPNITAGQVASAYALRDIGLALRDTGLDTISVEELMVRLKENGIEGELRGSLGRALAQCGFKYVQNRHGNFYRLPDVEQSEASA